VATIALADARIPHFDNLSKIHCNKCSTEVGKKTFKVHRFESVCAMCISREWSIPRIPEQL
jgi:formylmethanofuran dehydrogenase subunit E